VTYLIRSALLFRLGSDEVTARDFPGLIFMSESRSWADRRPVTATIRDKPRKETVA
jgi:hypothetical protein